MIKKLGARKGGFREQATIFSQFYRLPKIVYSQKKKKKKLALSPTQ